MKVTMDTSNGLARQDIAKIMATLEQHLAWDKENYARTEKWATQMNERISQLEKQGTRLQVLGAVALFLFLTINPILIALVLRALPSP